MENKKLPEVRFEEFSGDWKESKFFDLYKITSGYAFKMSDYSKTGITIINGESIQHNKIESNNFKYLPENFKEKYSQILLQTGDIVIGLNRPMTNGLLKIARIPRELSGSILYQRAGKIEYKQRISQDFSFVLLSKEILKFTLKEAVGSDQPFISTTKLSEWDFKVPVENEEQEKIGYFFKQLDDTIALHQQEFDKLKQTKQGFLQKMYPKEGKTVPEVRFSGFNGDWEERKLVEVVNITMGQSPNGENYTENPDDYILVQGNADIKNGWVAPRVWTTQVTKTADKGDIILSVRAPVGDVGRTQYDVVLGRGVAGIKGNEFIFQSLIKMKSSGYWTRYSTGSTFESINSNDLKEAIIRVPEEVEQNKIGEFFKQLDDIITLHQHELDALKETKKAFLQKMFI